MVVAPHLRRHRPEGTTHALTTSRTGEFAVRTSAVRATVRAGIGAALVGALIINATTPAAAAPGPVGPDGVRLLVPVGGTRPRWLGQAARVGPGTHDSTRTIRVALAPRDPGTALKAAQDASTPTSARYRQFLTGQQWRERFVPTDDTIGRVRGWLRAGGLSIDDSQPTTT